ncbi:MAG: hypothetical protein P4L61_03405 [Candidatus Pacebacteria bacterium]|nr:hypothetical protein [Candidatus Paceibacterota bacterium]
MLRLSYWKRKEHIVMAKMNPRIAAEDEIIATATTLLQKTFDPSRDQSFSDLFVEVAPIGGSLGYWHVNICCAQGAARPVGYMEFYGDGRLKDCSWPESVAFNVVRANYIAEWDLAVQCLS